MRAWYDQGSSETVWRTKELFSSSQVFTQVSNKRKYNKLIIKDLKRSYLSRTTNLLTPLSYFSCGFIIMIEKMQAPSLKPTGLRKLYVDVSAEFNVIVYYHHTSSTSKYGLQRSHLGRKNTPQTTTASFVPLVCQLFHVLITYELIVFSSSYFRI